MSMQIVRYKHGKLHFEVLTKPGAVLKFRNGNLGWDNVLASDTVFKNSQKAEKPSGAELAYGHFVNSPSEAFGTENEEECAKIIVDKGELQLSAAERKEKVDQVRHAIGVLKILTTS